jgi:hypothetical protein
MQFKEWLKQNDPSVDERQIDQVYDKARIAVQLVQWYRPELLYNISTIANLASGAYGLYNSAENNQVIDPSAEQRLIYRGHVSQQQIRSLPRKILRQYFPDLNPREIKVNDTVHVNIRRILMESKNDIEAVIRIGATIVHECTHEIEGETRGHTEETGPEAEARKFVAWAQQNMQQILQKFPVLSGNR